MTNKPFLAAAACALLLAGSACAQPVAALERADKDIRVVIDQAPGTDGDREINFYGSSKGAAVKPVLVTRMRVFVGTEESELDATAFRDIAFVNAQSLAVRTVAGGAVVTFEGGAPGSASDGYGAEYAFARTPVGLALMRRTVCAEPIHTCATTTFPEWWLID